MLLKATASRNLAKMGDLMARALPLLQKITGAPMFNKMIVDNLAEQPLLLSEQAHFPQCEGTPSDPEAAFS